MRKNMDILNRIKSYFDKPSIEEIAAYQHKLPNHITIRHWYDEKTGYYTAKIESIDGKEIKKAILITEDKTPAGLVRMINDIMFTYLDIPERMKPYLPQALPEDLDYEDKFIKEGQIVFAK